MAATLFADPPIATMEEARGHFTAAETLKPDGWIENRQFLAKCCINLQACSTLTDTFLLYIPCHCSILLPCSMQITKYNYHHCRKSLFHGNLLLYL